MKDSKRPHPIKSLGQHYLRDKKVVIKICRDFLSSATAIIEIGPGPGILTTELSRSNLPYYVIEKDNRFFPGLKKYLSIENITIGDALKIDLKQFIETKEDIVDKKIWLVSNLPYNVAAPLLISFIKTEKIKYMTLMFQKEVAQKIIGEKMNSLRALSNNYFITRMLAKVPPQSFMPAPKVDSIVLSFERIKEPVVPLSNFAVYEAFLRFLFAFKRKQLGTVLKAQYNIKEMDKVLESIGISKKERAETLKLKDIYKLYQKLVLKSIKYED